MKRGRNVVVRLERKAFVPDFPVEINSGLVIRGLLSEIDAPDEFDVPQDLMRD